ncbi:MAG TPA: hypothetical protein VKE40_20305 [Gemmataceae bacterium]|nr:hypothetical protein [Gemmataceae bacterium]
MRTNSLRRRLRVEHLEGRDVPAAVVTALVNGSLFVIGDVNADTITISQAAPGQVTISPGAGTTVDGLKVPVTRSFLGNLVIRLGAGNDNLSFDLFRPITLPGSLVIDYGTMGMGTKTTTTTNAGQFDLRVAGGLGIRYAAGQVTTTLDNLVVGGNALVVHGAGDSVLTFDNLGGAGQFSSIGRNLTVINTRGMAENNLLDTNVGGNVTFTNGLARASDNAAGSTTVKNANNAARATIGGNLVVSNLTGDSATGDTVGDVIVRGSVGLFLGSGAFRAAVADAAVTAAPVSIGGNLIVRGAAAGEDTVALGAGGTGLKVGQNVSAITGSRNAAITMDDLSVAGNTAVFTGAGADTVAIDGAAAAKGSTFGGSFTLSTGPGADAVTINSGSASSATTVFNRAVNVSLGLGDDSLHLATAGKVRFDAPIPLPVVFDGNAGMNTKMVTTGNLVGRHPTFLHFA